MPVTKQWRLTTQWKPVQQLRHTINTKMIAHYVVSSYRRLFSVRDRKVEENGRLRTLIVLLL